MSNFVDCLSVGVCLKSFSGLDLGLWFLRKNTLEMKCPLQHILSGALTLT